MALIIGTDSYITAADAATYLGKYHLSSESEMAAWAALSGEDKDVLLRKAAQRIDIQPLAGVRAQSTQSMEFPRAIFTHYASNIQIQASVPATIGQAQAEIALSMTLDGGESERIKLQREGVKSYSIGHLSETFGGVSRDPLPLEAQRLLAPYIGGGFEIV